MQIYMPFYQTEKSYKWILFIICMTVSTQVLTESAESYIL